MPSDRKPYPSDVTDEEWSLVVPYLTLMSEDAPQREYPLRELFSGLRYVIRYGIAWRAMPNDLPPWSAVYQQSQRWLAAGCFEALAHDLQCELIAAESGTKFQVRDQPRIGPVPLLGSAELSGRRRLGRRDCADRPILYG
jgi:transposase